MHLVLGWRLAWYPVLEQTWVEDRGREGECRRVSGDVAAVVENGEREE